MTRIINAQEAEVSFSQLLNRVSQGDEVTTTRDKFAIA